MDQNVTHTWSAQPPFHAQGDTGFLHTHTVRRAGTNTWHKHTLQESPSLMNSIWVSLRTDKLECVGAAEKRATGWACGIHLGSDRILAHCQIPLQENTHTSTAHITDKEMLYWHSLMTDSGQNVYHFFSTVEGNVSLPSKKKWKKKVVGEGEKGETENEWAWERERRREASPCVANSESKSSLTVTALETHFEEKTNLKNAREKNIQINKTSHKPLGPTASHAWFQYQKVL